MSETANTARAGELAFAEIFERFGWKMRGPRNKNWGCVSTHGEKQATKRKKMTIGEDSPPKKTHPTDAVYYYEDPYKGERVFVNADFKAYSKTTLDRVDMAVALRSMSHSVECANQSPEFQSLYYQGETGQTVGLVFVFNHDNDYLPAKFRKLVAAVAPDALEIAKGCRMFIIGPDRMAYLLTIANDMVLTHAHSAVRNHEKTFFFPNLIGHPATHHDALPLEALLGPWQILKLTGVAGQRPDTHYHIYLDGSGETAAEHEYLIDYLFRYQLLNDDSHIFLRFVFPSEHAAVQLETAKANYVARLLGLKEVTEKLQRVKYQPVTHVKLMFSETEIGMRRE